MKSVNKEPIENGELYQQIVEMSPDAVFVHVGGKVVFANPAMVRLMGAESPDQLTGMTALDIVHPDFHDRVMQIREDIAETNQPIDLQDFRFVALDGNVIDVEAAAAPIQWNGKDAISIVARDITDRKLVERVLRDSEIRFRDLIEGSPLPIQIMSLQSERLYVNQAFLDLLGYAAKEEIYSMRPPAQFVAPHHREMLNRIRTARERGEPAPSSYDFDMCRKDGSIVPVQVVIRSIDWQGKPAQQRTYVDLTERKQAERVLQESEARYRSVFEASPDAMLVTHVDGSIKFANTAALDLFGAETADQLLGRDMIELVHPKHRESVLRRRERSLQGQTAEITERTRLRLDGSEFPSESRGVRVTWEGEPAILVIIRDITERRRTEAALRESETQLRLVADASPVLISYIDRDRIIRFANKAFAARHGYTPDEIVGKHQAEFWGEDAHQNVNDLIEKTLAGNVTTNEGVREHADGTMHHHFTTRAPHFDDDGNVLGYFIIILDMTDQKRTEEQLRQSQKMEAVGQLTGGVAHDFNNLLTVILGSLEFIERRLDDPQLKNMARNALDASMRGADLTERLLAFSRKQSLSPKVVDLNECVGGMVHLMRTTLGESIDVEVRFADDLWQCTADPSQLENAILNLAINARDAMPQGGRLTIETMNVLLGDDFAASRPGFATGDYVMVSVSDDGAGIPQGILDRVFEPFFTTKDVGEGSGLGLSMVYGFVKQSGGDVEVKSEEGKGTTIRLYLPRSVEPGVPAEQAVVDDAPLGRGEKILLVEDQADVRTITVNILNELGYRVVEAAQGSEALEILQSTPEFDLLLTDIVLPGGLNGTDVAGRARGINPGIKVLFITGFSDEAVTRKGGVGAEFELLKKPFNKSGLGRKLRFVLDQTVD